MSPFLQRETHIRPLAQPADESAADSLIAQRDWPGPYQWTRVVRSSERASSMKKVDVSTDVARGVHSSHQRVIDRSNLPAGFFTRSVFLKLFRHRHTDDLSASIRNPANHKDVAASMITTRGCMKVQGNF